MNRTHVTGTLRKLAHTKRIECVVAGTVSKSGAHDATLKIEVIFCCSNERPGPREPKPRRNIEAQELGKHEFKPAEFHATCCGEKRFSPQQNFFAKTDMSHEENRRCNMSPLHVPAACPLVCADFQSNTSLRWLALCTVMYDLPQKQLAKSTN